VSQPPGGAPSQPLTDALPVPVRARPALPDAWRSLGIRYGTALGVAAIALGIRLAVSPVIGSSAPFLHSFPAIILVAWLAGFGPSVLVTLVTAATSLLVFIVPRWDVEIAARSDLVALVVYLGVGTLIGWMTNRFREERRTAEEARLAAEAATVAARDRAAHNERLVRVRDGFASMLAHELRTPLTVIIGDLALIRRLGDGLPPPAPELVRDMQAEAERLQVLVEDLLVLNRDDGQLELTLDPTSVRRTVEALLAGRAGADIPEGLVVDIPRGLPLVLADAVCLEQVLRNLLSNARKYGGPPVRLTAEACGRVVRISVEDNGPGIPPGEEERIFELFVRGAERRAGSPGAGVGLYVCRRLAAAMGGRIWAERRPTGGTAFRMELSVPAREE
jgi:two-component system, OmpR family, sensor histidine kinase KdpD